MLSTYVFLTTFFSGLNEKRKSEDGATAVEYGLMVALIAGVIIATVLALGGSLSDLFSVVGDKISSNTPT